MHDETVELQTIVERYARCIEHVDVSTTTLGVNARTGTVYHPGFKSLNEDPAVAAIVTAWAGLFPADRLSHRLHVRYPGLPATAKVDHVLSPVDEPQDEPEWGMEVKRLQFAGDNGKRNDYATAKVLSPFLKDRGVLHDAARLKHYGFTRRIAVLGYCFDYDSQTIAEARRRHSSPQALSTIREIEKIVQSNGPLRIRPLVEFADAILGLKGWSAGPRAQATFEAWTHPAGGHGTVFGWEIRRPELEVDYDPRHPW